MNEEIGVRQRVSARFYSNGTRQESMPATGATLDGGVIAVSESGSACFWVEDDD